MVRHLGLFLLLLVLPITAAQSQSIHTPQRGTMERRAILNTIRPMVEARLGSPVEFVVSFMRVQGNWAWLAVEPQRPGGGAIDHRSPDVRIWDSPDGFHTYALLTYDYDRWNLIDFAIGPTDVFWDGDPLYDQFSRAFLYGQ